MIEFEKNKHQIILEHGKEKDSRIDSRQVGKEGDSSDK